MSLALQTNCFIEVTQTYTTYIMFLKSSSSMDRVKNVLYDNVSSLRPDDTHYNMSETLSYKTFLFNEESWLKLQAELSLLHTTI